MVPDTHFGHILCPVDMMFQIYGHQGESESEHKVGSPYTTIFDLSTIVLGPNSFHCEFSVMKATLEVQFPSDR